MRGSAPQGSCGPSVPRVNPEVQSRVVLDAIVSTKTFGNATSAPSCFQILSCNFLCKLCGTFKTFEQELRLRVSSGRMNELKTNRSLSAATSLSIRTRPPSRIEMPGQMKKFKLFSLHFSPGHLLRAGSWYLRDTHRRSFCGGAYLYLVSVLPPAKPRAKAARWGVVQLVGHLTVNEDGEGSNPSAPANSFGPRARPDAASLWRSAGPLPASPSTRRPSIQRCGSPSSADCPPRARNGIPRHNKGSALHSCLGRVARYRAR